MPQRCLAEAQELNTSSSLPLTTAGLNLQTGGIKPMAARPRTVRTPGQHASYAACWKMVIARRSDAAVAQLRTHPLCESRLEPAKESTTGRVQQGHAVRG